MDRRLAAAREACAGGRVSEAINLVASIVNDADDERLLVAAAEVVPRPVDPVTRARLRLVIAQAASRVTTPVLLDQLNARLAETVDHFRPAAGLSPTAMDQFAVSGDRAGLLDAIAAFTAEATTPLDRSRLHLLLASQALMDGRFEDSLDHVDVATAFGGDGSDAFYLDPVSGRPWRVSPETGWTSSRPWSARSSRHCRRRPAAGSRSCSRRPGNAQNARDCGRRSRRMRTPSLPRRRSS